MKFLKYSYVPHIIILLIFIGVIIVSINRFIAIHHINGNDYSPISLYSAFKPLFFSSIPVIAVFYKSKFSWFIMLSYFYYLLANLLATAAFDPSFSGFLEVFVFLLFLVITVVAIYIMNALSVHKIQYSIDKNKLKSYNLIAFIVGCGISLFIFIAKNSRYYE